jgi:hypothetical protein
MRINSVPDVKSFCNNKNVLCAHQWCNISCATRLLSAILQTGVLAFSYGQFMTSIAYSMNYSIHLYVCNIDTLMLQF